MYEGVNHASNLQDGTGSRLEEWTHSELEGIIHRLTALAVWWRARGGDKYVARYFIIYTIYWIYIMPRQGINDKKSTDIEIIESSTC